MGNPSLEAGGILFHRATSPWAFPLDACTLEVTVRTSGEGVVSVAASHGDRYDRSISVLAPLTLEGSDGVSSYWRAALPFPMHRARYVFRIETGTGVAWLGEDGVHTDEAAAKPFEVPYLHASECFQPPEWLHGAIFYQVFPDRFRNGDPSIDPPGVSAWGTPPARGVTCGGDVAGVRQAIPYLRELGVTALYSTPLFRSPSNHKYDTTDYGTVDPAFGSNEDLIGLSDDLHAADMRLVLDGVFNHSGREWPPFVDVCRHGADSQYADWFHDVHFPIDTEAVNYETFATRVKTMPKLNLASPSLREYLLDIVERWTREAHLDGWRLDVGNEVPLSFWRAFRERVRTVNPEAFLLVEAWIDSLDFLRGDTFDAATNYPWREAVLAFVCGRSTGTKLLEDLTRVRMTYPSVVSHSCVHLLGSHDTPRIRTLAGSPERAIMAAVLLCTSPGVLLVYYGDEVGLEGGDDPDCRRCFPWDDPSSPPPRHRNRLPPPHRPPPRQPLAAHRPLAAPPGMLRSRLRLHLYRRRAARGRAA